MKTEPLSVLRDFRRRSRSTLYRSHKDGERVLARPGSTGRDMEGIANNATVVYNLSACSQARIKGVGRREINLSGLAVA